MTTVGGRFRVTPGKAAMLVALPGLIAFVMAVIAENKKPDPVPNLFIAATNISTCHYPNDPTPALGIMSCIFLFISAILAFAAIHYPYSGKSVSPVVLLRSTSLLVFGILSVIIFCVAEFLLIWALLQEFQHRNNNVHIGNIDDCPTAKSGLLGGAGFLALDATLFFLITLMLTNNARSDYLDEYEEDNKGSYGEVTTYPPPTNGHETQRV